MKLYLSSYRLGDHSSELKKLINNPDAKIAVCMNALDHIDPAKRNEKHLQRELEDMSLLGYQSEELDLRNYFDNDSLREEIKKYDAIWVSGGNVFLLAKAFRQSGFDKILSDSVADGDIAYTGYSAAFCVLYESLSGMELVDDINVHAEDYSMEKNLNGFDLIDFHPIVHFRSNHHESDLVELEYKYVQENNIPHKTFVDGDVYVVDGEFKRVHSIKV